jgi:hypothetical protein
MPLEMMKMTPIAEFTRCEVDSQQNQKIEQSPLSFLELVLFFFSRFFSISTFEVL